MSFLRTRYKCCVIGDHGVGKTSIIHALLGKPVDKLQSTIGIDFFSKTVLLDNQDVYVTIWDTAGAERYHSLMHSYLRGSDIVIVVYDLTRIDAMQSLTYWLRQIEYNKPSVVVILGNKNDLSQVTKHAIHDTLQPYMRQHWSILTSKCSSRRREPIKNIFQKSILMITKQGDFPKEIHKLVRITSRKNRQTQKCCT